MDNICNKENYRDIEQLINDFCQIVLTKNDDLDTDAAKQYIDELTNEDKCNLNLKNPEQDQKIRLILQSAITQYLKSFDKLSDNDGIQYPFEFNNGINFSAFSNVCEEHYRSNNQQAPLPPVIGFTLKYIQEMSEHYRIFGSFYEVRSLETSSGIISKMESVAREQTRMAVQETAKEIAAEEAKKAVENVVNEKISDVTQKASESNVTILGIFAGIVLTIVAGLFYSSSVLDNVMSANFYRLVSISALVGFVCYNLIAIMFQFIERIRDNSKKTTSYFNKVTLFVNITLLVIMICFCVLQFIVSANNKNNNQVDLDISREETSEAEITEPFNEEKTDIEIETKNH